LRLGSLATGFNATFYSPYFSRCSIAGETIKNQ